MSKGYLLGTRSASPGPYRVFPICSCFFLERYTNLSRQRRFVSLKLLWYTLFLLCTFQLLIIVFISYVLQHGFDNPFSSHPCTLLLRTTLHSEIFLVLVQCSLRPFQTTSGVKFTRRIGCKNVSRVFSLIPIMSCTQLLLAPFVLWILLLSGFLAVRYILISCFTRVERSHLLSLASRPHRWFIILVSIALLWSCYRELTFESPYLNLTTRSMCVCWFFIRSKLSSLFVIITTFSTIPIQGTHRLVSKGGSGQRHRVWLLNFEASLGISLCRDFQDRNDSSSTVSVQTVKMVVRVFTFSFLILIGFAYVAFFQDYSTLIASF